MDIIYLSAFSNRYHNIFMGFMGFPFTLLKKWGLCLCLELYLFLSEKLNLF
jgi:hypothetical protein